MSKALIRETPFGRWLNAVSKGKILPYEEQKPEFQLPEKYRQALDAASLSDKTVREDGSHKHDHIVVDWYGPDDPENPKNFALAQKIWISFSISAFTFSAYAGSSIVSPSIPGLMEEFGVTYVKGVLTMSAYILGYAIGPLFLSPPSDIPALGRGIPYWTSMLALVLFNVGAAVTTSYPGLIILRLLAGMAGSPALATGGATMQDIWSDLVVARAIALWAAGAVCGPSLAPIIAGFAAMNVSWRLPYWISVALSGLGLLNVFFLLPETLSANILLRRAQRLRQLTGDHRLRSQSEIDNGERSLARFMLEGLWMPIRLSIEPIVAYTSVLLGLVYAIFYVAFEATPIIFGEVHGFNMGQSTLPYLGINVNLWVLVLPGYLAYLAYYFDPRFVANMKRGIIRPEDRLILGIACSPLVVVALLWIGWTSRSDISYWSPLLALSLYLMPVFYLFQSILVYLPFTYPTQAASVLAANDFIRSIIAACFPLFARPLFEHEGLGNGYTILAGCSAALLIPLFGLYRYGERIRRASKWAHCYDLDVKEAQSPDSQETA
ncbi:unnamed protein product [Sympodiomycopsis kandeliae]